MSTPAVALRSSPDRCAPAPRAARRELQLTGLRLGRRDELLDRVVRRRRIHDEDQRDVPDVRDRREESLLVSYGSLPMKIGLGACAE
jgi:hypothetical protein